MSQVDVHVGDHVLLFYRRDSELVDQVCEHLASGIEQDEVIVVIATADHREAIRTHLAKSCGSASEPAWHAHFFELDAAVTLGRLKSDGRIDPAKFHDLVGRVVREASVSGRPVRAYGEMVTLLWEAGDVLSAIELETLWNELQAELPFSLVCAYPIPSCAGEKDGLDEVCGLHSSAISPMDESENTVTARYLPTIDSPTAARHLLVESLQDWGCTTDVVDDGAMVITELTGNAVNHVGEPFFVTIALKSGIVRISVRDTSTSIPVATKVGASALSGRGLSIIEALACNWGVNIASDHKTVWADLVAPELGA
jgi:hypothetical protein